MSAFPPVLRGRRIRAGKAEQLLGLGDAAEPMGAQGDQRRRDSAGERPGGKERAAQLLGRALDPEGKVDRGADDREVEATGRADVAVEDVAQVQPDAGAERRTIRVPSWRAAEGVEAGQRLGRGLERRGGSSRLAKLGYREDREQPSPRNFSTSPPCACTGSATCSK